MSNPANHPKSWKEALLALIQPFRVPDRAGAARARLLAELQLDDDREAFHLDDTGVADRVRRDNGLAHYRTPPHARLVFPTLTQP